MNFFVKTSVMIRQYGRFSVHALDVYKGEQGFPPTRREIVLDRPNASSLPLTSIPAEFNDTVYVMASICQWLYGQQYQIALTTQWMSEPQTIHALECSQNSLDGQVPHYQEVLQAYQEMDPDYRLEEPPNWERRNVHYYFVGGHLCPVVYPGTFQRDVGKFRMYEVHECEDGVFLAPFSDVCLVISEEEVLRLGDIAHSDVDDAALQAFVDSWMAFQEQAIHKIKGNLPTIVDPERKARWQKMLSQKESSWLAVACAVDELKRPKQVVVRGQTSGADRNIADRCRCGARGSSQWLIGETRELDRAFEKFPKERGSPSNSVK